jgi:predicted Zn-dependent protease
MEVLHMARGQAQVEMTEREMDEVTKNTKQLLDEQPKVTVRLHLNQETKQRIDAAKEAGKAFEIPFETVCINGYIYQIQRGEKVEVPQTVADILEEAGLI